jgi:hypothetical protein
MQKLSAEKPHGVLPTGWHVYPLVRTQKQLDRVLAEIDEALGIVLYTRRSARIVYWG